MTLRNLINAAVVTTTSTGSGNLTLGAPKEGYFAIPEGFVGDVHILMGEHSEVSRCKVSDGSLERLECIKSTNNNDFVDLPVGEKNVAAVLTKEYLSELKPSVSVDAVHGINERLRQYVAMYSHLILGTVEDRWVLWTRVMEKPETYPPSEHGHEFEAFGNLDYESDILTNKPREFKTFVEAPLLHSHGTLDRRQRRQTIRRAYMYGGM